jgi:integrase
VRVTEKGGKTQRKALLEAAGPLLEYLAAAGIALGDSEAPLFQPVAKDRQTLIRKHLTRSTILALVKKHARKAGINPIRFGTRGLGVHSLRKTAITNALQNGAPMETPGH